MPDFDLSYWLFKETIQSIDAAIASLKGIEAYVRLTPAGDLLETPSLVGFVKAHTLRDPAWMPLVSSVFDRSALLQTLTNDGFDGYANGSKQVSSLSVLFLALVDSRVFAITAGSASSMLDKNMIVVGAGREAMLNRTPDGRVTEVGWSSGGGRGRQVTERHATPVSMDRYVKTQDPRILGKFGGIADLDGLTIQTEGNTQLRLPSTADAHILIDNCRRMLSAYNDTQARPIEFDLFTDAEHIRDTDLQNKLLTELLTELKSGKPLDLSIIVPHVPEGVTPVYTLHYQEGPRKHFQIAGTLATWSEKDIRTIISHICKTVWHLQSLEVRRDTDEALFPLLDCLSCVIVYDSQRYILDNGEWHRVSGMFITKLNDFTRWFISTCSVPTVMPDFSLAQHMHPTKKQIDEGLYNAWASQQLKFTCLDFGKARPPFGGSPLELCDMFSPAGEMYCVKRGITAQPVVYVTNQAISAARALRSDPSYWQYYVDHQMIVHADSPYDSPEKFRAVIGLVTDDPQNVATNLRYKAKLALRDFHYTLRELDFHPGFCAIKEVL